MSVGLPFAAQAGRERLVRASPERSGRRLVHSRTNQRIPKADDTVRDLKEPEQLHLLFRRRWNTQALGRRTQRRERPESSAAAMSSNKRTWSLALSTSRPYARSTRLEIGTGASGGALSASRLHSAMASGSPCVRRKISSSCVSGGLPVIAAATHGLPRDQAPGRAPPPGARCQARGAGHPVPRGSCPQARR